MSSDATPAYRGYRLQALYVLWRMLESTDSAHLIFQPEGHEDLAIYTSDENLLEVVQVKAHEGDLVLSSLLPPKPKPGSLHQRDSFFYRAASLLKTNPQLAISIVSFGTIGSELLRAFQTDGHERKNIAKKLREHKNLTEEDINQLMAKISAESVDEATLTKQVQTILGESLMGIDSESAFDLLSYWLYICAEHKEKITQREVIEKVNKVGLFLADRAAYYQEWFTSIIPIEDKDIESEKEVLREEFYQGIAAQYSHILAGLDVPRPQKLQEIAEKFTEKRVVIIHAASGQGKTTLAYRYLHDFFPDKWRFQVQLTESRIHALRIARALMGHVDAINIPIVVYIDVSSSDVGWPELVKQLSFHQNIHVLVTIREEDWRRASISGTEIQFSSVDLSFEDTEAQEIYQSLREKHVPVALLSFQEAWRRFGRDGPLMEFVYLVTSGNSLRERLSQQVRHLEDEVREGRMQRAELELLRLVSIASAYEAHLKIKPLVEYLHLPAPIRTLNLFEKEYLLRQVADGSLVYGLHPLRSAIVADLLTDSTFSPWSESARQCIPYLYEPDIETFLLYAFSRRHTDAKHLLTFLEAYQPDHWVAIAGITRSLLWIGIREYIDNNQQLILEVYKDSGSGWITILDFDIADAMPGSGTSLWNNLGDHLSQEGRQRIEAFQARQTDKQQVFTHARAWLSLQTQKPEAAVSVADWASVAETLFWVGYVGIQWPVVKWFADGTLEKTLDSLPISVLADLIVGLSYGYGDLFLNWLERHRIKLIDRFRREMQVVTLEDDGQKLTLHFIIAIEQKLTAQSNSKQNDQNDKDSLHREAIQRVELLRKLLPDREMYACQGYGHRIWAKPLPFDSTLKTGIPKSRLPLSWLISINATFRGLAEQSFRLATWQGYAQEVFVLRQTVVHMLIQLETVLDAYFRKSVVVRLPAKPIDSDEWLRLQRLLHNYPLLPSCALDEWGFIDEYTARAIDQQREEIQSLLEKRGLIIQEYTPFLPAFREYIRTLDNFFNQAIETMIFNSRFGKGKRAKTERLKAVEQLQQQEKYTKADRLSTMNLAGAVKGLVTLQSAFRQLLSQYIDKKVLINVEEQEQNLYYRVWSMWYFFAYHPHLALMDAKQKCPKHMMDDLKKMRQQMQREFDKLASDNLSVTIISKDNLWVSKPALWLTINGKNALEVYNSIAQVITAIRHALSDSEDTELRRYVLDFHWPFVVIVPLIQGKSLNAMAWRISLPVLLSDSEISGLNWWNFVLQSISSEEMTKVGISTWNLPHLEDVTMLMASTAELSLLLGHIRDFKHLPELDVSGNGILQQYIQSLSGHISKILQRLGNAVTKIASSITNIAPTEYIHHPNLEIVVQALQEFGNIIIPPTYSQCGAEMSHNQLIEWANQLEKASEYASFIYLVWASDIVDEVEK